MYRGRLESLLAVDRMVGEIVSALRDEGELDSTYILFTSDNGYLLGEHGEMGKHLVFEESIRVPLAIRGPGLPAGEKRSEPVQNIDLAPTITELAGVQAQRLMDGVPVLGGPRLNPERDLFVTYPDSALAYDAVRSADGFTYAEYGTGEIELYDLNKDPHQLVNVADKPDTPTLSSGCPSGSTSSAAVRARPAIRRWTLAFAAVGAALAAVPASAGPPDLVELRTTGDRSERYETIPITRERGAEPRVAMSLAPDQLPDLLEGTGCR